MFFKYTSRTYSTWHVVLRAGVGGGASRTRRVSTPLHVCVCAQHVVLAQTPSLGSAGECEHLDLFPMRRRTYDESEGDNINVLCRKITVMQS